MQEFRSLLHTLDGMAAEYRTEVQQSSPIEFIRDRQKKIDDSNGTLTWRDFAVEEYSKNAHNKHVILNMLERMSDLFKKAFNIR